MNLLRVSAIVLAHFALSVHAADDVEPTHCTSNERVFFSCMVGTKIVSICATPAAAPFEALEYRYGAKDKVEMRYNAGPSNGNRFYAYVAPVNPRALVYQVWFNRSDTRYMVTQCEGGNCPRKSGLIVYQKTKPIMSRPCNPNPNGHDYFDRAIVRFGSSFSDSSSRTDLLILDETAYDIDSLYPYNRVQ